MERKNNVQGSCGCAQRTDRRRLNVQARNAKNARALMCRKLL